MYIPTKESFVDMSATDFEKFCLHTLKQQTQGLEKVEFEHDVVVKKGDGNYQIDGIIRFEVMGIKYTTLVECKHYKSSISREKVQVLHDKIRQIGAHKGILISTSNFQKGAITYASEHGIALIQITNEGPRFEIRGYHDVPQEQLNLQNNGNTFIGVMLEGTSSGISCQYLRNCNTALKNYLCEI